MATATRRTRVPTPTAPKPPPADLVQIVIARPLVEFAVRQWRAYFEREQLHINTDRRRDLQPVEMLIGTLGQQLSVAPTVLAVDHSGRQLRAYPIVGTASYWLRAANWCLSEAWRTKNTRAIQSQAATLGLLIVTAISPVLLRGRGEEAIPEPADGWSET